MKTRLILLASVVVLAIAPALAQVSTSNITGVVQDSSGALIAGAKVVVTNEATGVAYEMQTNSSGAYGVSSVPPGSYSVTVSKEGFRTFSSTKNILQVGAPLVVNATLQVGAATETVQVESTYERLETTSSMISDVVTHKEVKELPLNGRNPLTLIALEPGLVQRTTNSAGSGTHVFGSRDRSHNVTVDGIDANESSVPNPQSNITGLTPDNVREYRVVTHNPTAEFGRNSGANVAVATKSGTNEIHGDVFWFHRNTALNADEWFNKYDRIVNRNTQAVKPVLLLNQWGTDVGGPIIKNKTFFFGSYQGNRIKQTQPIAQSFGIPSVYTATLRQGIFRYVRGTVNGFTQNDARLVDANGNLLPGVPVCSGTVTNNCVASYNINAANDPQGIGMDPKILELVSKLPLPNSYSSVGDGLNFAGFAWNPPSTFKGPSWLARIDHTFNENNNIFGRFLYRNYDTLDGDLLNARPKIYPGFPPTGEVFREGRNLAVSYRRAFSPTVVNEFTTGFNRFNFLFTWGESNPDFGNPAKVPPYSDSCATTTFSLIDPPYCISPRTQRAVTTLQFIDNLSISRRRHNIRTGFNIRSYRHIDNRGFASGSTIAPSIAFSQSVRQSGFLNIPSSGINSVDLANLQQAVVELAGIPSSLSQAFAGDLVKDVFPAGALQKAHTNAKQFNFYVQDEWKMTSNLTINAGLRWELNLPPHDAAGATFVPNKPFDLNGASNVSFVKADRWWKRDNYNTVAPRLSFAYSPFKDHKTVIRAGYGMAFDTLSTFQVTAMAGKVPGAALSCIVRPANPPAAATVSSGCVLPANTDKRIAQGFPLSIAAPTSKPSNALSLPVQPFGIAPNVGAFQANLHTPTVHEWSLSIQRELPLSLVAQVGYIGKHGTHLYRAYDVNQIRTDQPGFLESFLIAQQNVFKGCRADGTNCPAGVTGQTPTLLRDLTSTSFLNSSTTRTNLLDNGLGELARRIDQQTGASAITAKGFPANYFRPYPQFGEVFFMDANGGSVYHGLLAQLRRRFERGLTLGVAYTFSKSIDDMSVDPVGASSGGGLSSTNSRTPTDIRNFRLDRARSDFDNTHVLVLDYLYELPFGRGQRWGAGWPGIVNHILGGWSMTGIYNFQSGEPFTVLSGRRTGNGYKVSNAILKGPMPDSSLKFVDGIEGPVLWEVGSRITTVGDPNYNCRNVLGTQSYFCIPPPGSNGGGRNTAQGPGFWNFDFGVSKRFSITERFNLQFRTEFFNVFNHVNFENPRNATVGSPQVTSSQFGRTCCVTGALPSSATIIALGEPNRVIQFGLKLAF